MDCAIVLSISTVSLVCQGTLVLYRAAGVVEKWLSEGFGAGRRIDRKDAMTSLFISVILFIFLCSAQGFSPVPLRTRFLQYKPSRVLYTANDTGSSDSVSSRGSSVARSISVITDIDDTVKSSGGKKILGISLGGIDKQFKRGEFYPGVFQFFYELGNRKSHLDGMYKDREYTTTRNVHVLTARAKELKFALEIKEGDKISTRFKKTGLANGNKKWGIGSVYYGSVQEWIVQQWKGLRKFENFELMRKDHISENMKDEYIFIGDTGEMDEVAGEYMAAKYPNALKAVFLHVVSSKPVYDFSRFPKDRKVNNVKFLYFKTYVGASVKAVQNDLMSIAGLKRVIAEVEADLEKNTAKIGKSIKKSAYQDLMNDIKSASRFIVDYEAERTFDKLDERVAKL